MLAARADGAVAVGGDYSFALSSGSAVANLSRIRRITLLLLKNENTCTQNIKRAKASYDRSCLLTLLGFNPGKVKASP